MAAEYYGPLSDMSRIKESLMSLLCDSKDVTKLIMPTLDNPNFTLEQNWYGGTFDKDINGQTETSTLMGHCFDAPYMEGAITDNRCAVFIETYLSKIENQHIKEVSVDIMVVCHKDLTKLSETDKNYYNPTGVYGNRIDSAVQVINSLILNSDTIKENYSIGNMNLTKITPLNQYVPDTKFYGKCLSYTYQSFYRRKNNVR